MCHNKETEILRINATLVSIKSGKSNEKLT